jgi:hypothetical protein
MSKPFVKSNKFFAPLRTIIPGRILFVAAVQGSQIRRKTVHTGGLGNMTKTRRWQSLWSFGFGLFLVALTGCQTWVTEAGSTLPSGHYLEHPPQYIPPSPAFPLPRELISMEAGGAVAGAAAGQPAAAAPPAVAPVVP